MASSAVRIVVFERSRDEAGVTAATHARRDVSGKRDASDVRDALASLGADLRFDLVHELAACFKAVARPDVDLVLLDRIDASNWRPVTRVTGEDGPPVVVIHDGPDESAVDAFRAGAADCVRADAAGLGALPVVALEQIHRYRPERDRQSDRRRIASLEHFSAGVVQNLVSGLVVVDESGRVRFANPAAGRIFGVDPSALSGRPVSSAWGDNEASAWVRHAIEEGVSIRGREVLLSRGDGTCLPVGLSASPMRDEALDTKAAVVILDDLSELKQLQRQVLQSEKMASIGQLAAGVAHEINNPTGFIHANLIQLSEYLVDLDRYWASVDRLKQAVGEGTEADARAALQALDAVEKQIDLEFLRSDLGQAVRESQEGAERIRHIVQDLRDFSHQGTGELLPSDVNQCLESTAHIVWTMMRHTVLLEKQYGELPPVQCYPMQLKQVFMNLLVNAYQAIEARGLSASPGVIRIETASGDEGVQISISDTGVGIPRQHVGRIFDPFFTTKEPGEGTGLGLSLSYAIVERHGGLMKVESEVGEGTRFEIWLPYAGGECATADDGDHLDG
jgi:PAS domain S-box-containing protein